MEGAGAVSGRALTSDLCSPAPPPTCSPELPVLGLVREGLAQQGPQGGQVSSSRDLQGQSEGTLHRDGHQRCRAHRGHSLGQGRKAVVSL